MQYMEQTELLYRLANASINDRREMIKGVQRIFLGGSLGYSYVPIFGQKQDPLADQNDKSVLVAVETVGGFAFIRADKKDVDGSIKGAYIGRIKYDAIVQIRQFSS